MVEMSTVKKIHDSVIVNPIQKTESRKKPLDDELKAKVSTKLLEDVKFRTILGEVSSVREQICYEVQFGNKK